MKRFVLVMLIFVLLVPVISQAQIKNPNIPRTWWDQLETFIRSISDNNIQHFQYDTLFIAAGASDTMGIWRNPRAVQIQRTNLSWFNATLNDSIVILIYSGNTDTLLKAVDDSLATGAGSNLTKFFENTSTFDFTAGELDTLVIVNTGGTANKISRFLLSIYTKIK